MMVTPDWQDIGAGKKMYIHRFVLLASLALGSVLAFKKSDSALHHHI